MLWLTPVRCLLKWISPIWSSCAMQLTQGVWQSRSHKSKKARNSLFQIRKTIESTLLCLARCDGRDRDGCAQCFTANLREGVCSPVRFVQEHQELRPIHSGQRGTVWKGVGHSLTPQRHNTVLGTRRPFWDDQCRTRLFTSFNISFLHCRNERNNLKRIRMS